MWMEYKLLPVRLELMQSLVSSKLSEFKSARELEDAGHEILILEALISESLTDSRMSMRGLEYWQQDRQLLDGKSFPLFNRDLSLPPPPRAFGPLLHSQLVGSARTNMSASQ